MSVAELQPVGDSDFGRTPPQDVYAEQCVIGGMLLSKDAIADVVEVLRSGDFYRPAHQVLFDAIVDLYGRGDPADAVTVAADLTKHGDIARVGGADYLHTVMALVPVAANAGYYARIVHERAILRRLVEAGSRITQMGYSADAEVDDIVDRAQAEIYSVTERRTGDDYLRLGEVLPSTLDEIEAIGSRGGAIFGVPTGFSELDQLTNGLHPGQMIILAARPAIGKALAIDTPLPTPDGWTTMRDVQVGDRLIGADGCPTTVIAATDVMYGRPCYRVGFSDDTSIIADAKHQWLTETRASRRSAQQARTGANLYRNQRTFAAVRTTEEIATTLRCETSDRRINHSVTNASALILPTCEPPVAPYTLGVWLGDGTTASASFTTTDPEIVDFVRAEGYEVVAANTPMRYGVRLPEPPPLPERACEVCGRSFRPCTTQVKTCGRSCGGRARFVSAPRPEPVCPQCGERRTGNGLCARCRRKRGSVQALLRHIGVLGEKHIPPQYLRAAEWQRRALLAGLLDTDGTVTRTGAVQFACTSRRLAADVHDLVVGLGYRCGVSSKLVNGRTEASSTCWVLTFTPLEDVFRLDRKRRAQKERAGSAYHRVGARYITSVDRIASVPVRCVQVDNADQMYLAGRSMVPTHNSTLALDLIRSASVKHGLASVIFSLEMSRSEITMRLLSAEAKVALHAMRSGTLSDDDWTRLARRMSEVSEAPLFIDDSPNMSMMEIRAKARRLKQQHDLRVVVVDYMQLMHSPRRVESRQQEVSEISRSMKLLAKEIDVPIIAISQLNRSPEQRNDKKPQLSDLRESGSLEQDADMVILLNREDAYERESPRAGEADMIVAKHRNGPTKTVTVAFQGHYSRFVDMAPA
ncbi:MAG: replicative DNA helicase [Streptosporangiales bacterium]